MEFSATVDYKLIDLIDIPRLQELLDCLHVAFGLTTAILDSDGNILIASGWQDICTKFHRVHPVCAQQCTMSDLYIFSHLKEGQQSVTYKCMQGLLDSATPIMIAGKHLGNVYIGQFLTEPPDIEYFRKQAQKYGFDEEAYIEALSKVPVLTSEELEQRLRIIRMLTEFIGEIGLERLNEIENKQRLAEAQRIAQLGSWEYDVPTNYLTWSDEMYRILGLELQEIPPSEELFMDIIYPDDRERVHAAYTQSLQQGISNNAEYRIVRRSDGEIRYVNEIYECVKDTTGEVVRIFGMLHDITERKRAEEASKESQRALTTLISNLQGIVYRCRNDKDWTMEFVSEGALELTGYEPSDIIENKNVSYGRQIVHPDDQACVWKDIQAAISKGEPFKVTYRIITAAGEEKWGWEQGRGVFSQTNELLSIEGFIADITERVRAEEERRQMKEHLEAQKRQFYRETILSVTSGKLEICDQSDIDRYISTALLTMNVNAMQDVSTARHRIRHFFEEKGLNGDRLDSFMDGVGEAVTNAVKHGINGVVYGGSTGDAVWVAVTDKGKGIESLILPHATLGRGFSTKRSMGLGYTIILNVADHVLLNTGSGGTNVVMIINLVEPELKVSIDSLPDTWL